MPERFIKAFRHNPDPISITTIEEGRFIDINYAFTKTLGYELEELREMSNQQKIWVNVEQLKRSMHEIKDKRCLRDFEAEIRCKSGKIKTILLAAETIDVGNESYVVMVGRDISDRKQTEVQLREERNFNATILDNTSDLILVCDQAGQVLRFNRACEELSGYFFEELRGLFIWDFILAPEYVAKTKDLLEAEIADRAVLNRQEKYENIWITRTGEHRLISWTTTFLNDESGLITYSISTGNDITQQRKMEDRLRKSEAELRTIYENANGIIYTLSAEGQFIYVSRGWTEMLGHDISEVEGQSFAIFVHPDDIIVCQKFLEKVINSGEPQQGVEYRVKHKNGSWRWHASSGAAVKEGEGNHLYYVGLAQDITEQKHTEAALKISEEKFAKAFLCNPDPISITTLMEGRYVEVNDAWLETTGYERQEVIGRTALELNIWISQKERNLFIWQLRDNAYACRSVETRFRMKSGEIRNFLFSTEVIDMGGKPHLLWATKDISERKRTEEALRLSEDKFAKAFSASPTPMCITSLYEGKFLAVNDSFCRVLDCGQEKILEKTSFELDLWVNLNDRRLVIEKIINKESVRDIEVLFRRESGEQRIGSYSAEGIDINGKPCILTILTDINGRKKAEEEIKYLSFHDKLTGLYNRAYFEEELKRLDTERQLPLSLIMGDVNGLKLINDALGHQEGDKLLIMVAHILKTACRQEDVVARWGGDEFIILLPRCDHDSAVKILERIRGACKLGNDLPIDASISLGLAVKTTMSQNMRERIKEAEDKMYRNKLLASRSTRSAFIISLEKTLWSRSHETEEHCRRIQDGVLRMGQLINLPDSELDNLKLLALLHDIGKIAIPNEILEKPGRLNHEEWETMKKHPEIGYRIALSSPEMAPIAEALLHHHERWNGTGYPLGIKGDKIPLMSRMIAIVDAYDVMINGRPYQKPISPQEAWYEIERCAGTQFDPELVSKARGLLVE